MSEAHRRAHALSDEGEALFQANDIVGAQARYREAVALEPTAARLHNLATSCQMLADHARAEAAFRRALALRPDHPPTLASLGCSLLAQGRWAEGFAAYDAGISAKSEIPADIGIPIWRGEPAAGLRIAIWGEEGFGDQIMFARFARLLAAEGAEVGWAAPTPLARLLREGLGQMVAVRRKGLEIRNVDYIVGTTGLAAAMMQRLAEPPPAPYLAPPPPNRIAGLTIGVVGSGNPEHNNDRNRSLDAAATAALMALPGAVSLKPEDTGARDFWDTAGIVMGLDLVISADTSVVHLAGALGKPCWVLLPAIGCDWRWGPAGDTTPWYPTLRLFRQTTPGDWGGVIDAVKAALK